MMTNLEGKTPIADTTALFSRQREYLTQARAKFIFFKANPHTYYDTESVNKTVQDIRDAVDQAGVGGDLARLDRTGQTTTQDMEAALAETIEAAMDYVREYNRNEFSM